ILWKCFCFLIAVLLCETPAVILAQGFSPTSPSSATQSAGGRSSRTIGAPQVLEIPSPQNVAPAPDVSSSTETVPPAGTLPPSYERVLGAGDPNDGGLQPETAMPAPTKRNYLGVLYATAEEGPVGVKVLDVVQGSPAARAGFRGVNTP